MSETGVRRTTLRNTNVDSRECKMVEGLGAVEQRFETGVRWTTLWIMDDGAVERDFNQGSDGQPHRLWIHE